MCHPNPGPRCSNHAYREYVAALQNFEAVQDNASKKISLGKIVEEKQLVLDSTPRGQSRLRQEINVTTDPIEKGLLEKRLTDGIALRKNQLEALYSYKDSSAKEEKLQLKAAGLKNKYALATGIAFERIPRLVKNNDLSLEVLSSHYLEVNSVVEPMSAAEEESTEGSDPVDINYSTVSGSLKILTLTPKYQDSWAVAKFEDEQYQSEEGLQEILNTSIDLMDLSSEEQSKAHRWFENKLMEDQVNLVSPVDVNSLEVMLITPTEVGKLYSIGFKLRKKLGGTSPYVGSAEDLQSKLENTVFASGSVEQSESKPPITLLFGVPNQPKQDCLIGEDILLSWHPKEFFQVRKRHISNTYEVIVVLKAKKSFMTGASTSALSVFHKSEEAETED